jgi:hypothetical protein
LLTWQQISEARNQTDLMLIEASRCTEEALKRMKQVQQMVVQLDSAFGGNFMLSDQPVTSPRNRQRARVFFRYNSNLSRLQSEALDSLLASRVWAMVAKVVVPEEDPQKAVEMLRLIRASGWLKTGTRRKINARKGRKTNKQKPTRRKRS